VRPFLLDFENHRKMNRDQQKQLGAAADVDLQYSRYDTLNRSTNDATSNRDRVEILRSAFVDYLDELYNLDGSSPFI
jgi:hypothetical protein